MPISALGGAKKIDPKTIAFDTRNTTGASAQVVVNTTPEPASEDSGFYVSDNDAVEVQIVSPRLTIAFDGATLDDSDPNKLVVNIASSASLEHWEEFAGSIFIPKGVADTIPAIIKWKGDGALQVDELGNARGFYSIDLQASRQNDTEVCSGYLSFIATGTDNTNAGNYSSIITSNGCSITDGTYCGIIGGDGVAIDGVSSTTIVGGTLVTADNRASKSFSAASQSAFMKEPHQTALSTRSHYLEHRGEIASGATLGHSHAIRLQLFAETSDTTPVRMGLFETGDTLPYNNLFLPTTFGGDALKAHWAFEGLIVCSANAGLNTRGAWKIVGALWRTGPNPEDLELSVAVVPIGLPSLGLGVAVQTHDADFSGIEVIVTGDADVTITWGCTMDIVQVMTAE